MTIPGKGLPVCHSLLYDNTMTPTKDGGRVRIPCSCDLSDGRRDCKAGRHEGIRNGMANAFKYVWGVARPPNERKLKQYMARDEKGRFTKGNTEGHRFTRNGDARESGAKGTAVREERKKERQTLAEVLRQELQKKAAAGSEMTKMQYLVAKALENHSKGALSLKDLTYMQRLLGEDVLNINTNGPQVVIVSEKSIKAAEKWGSKE